MHSSVCRLVLSTLSYHNRYVTKHSHSVCRTQRSCRSGTRNVYQSLSLQRARLFGLSLSHPASQSVISLSYHSKSDARIRSACSCRSVAIRLTPTLFVALPLSLSLSVSHSAYPVTIATSLKQSVCRTQSVTRTATRTVTRAVC